MVSDLFQDNRQFLRSLNFPYLVFLKWYRLPSVLLLFKVSHSCYGVQEEKVFYQCLCCLCTITKAGYLKDVKISWTRSSLQKEPCYHYCPFPLFPCLAWSDLIFLHLTFFFVLSFFGSRQYKNIMALKKEMDSWHWRVNPSVFLAKEDRDSKIVLKTLWLWPFRTQIRRRRSKEVI